MRKIIWLFFLTIIAVSAYSQKIDKKHVILDKWTKATVNVLCYSKTQRDALIWLDSLFAVRQIDTASYSNYVRQIIMSASWGTATWLKYNNHNFLLSARHVLEDLSLGEGVCFSDIYIVENDTSHSVKLASFQLGPKRTAMAELGTPVNDLQINNKKLYKFSSKDDDVVVVNIDSSYYAYGVEKFLKSNGYKPVDLNDVDTLFRVKNQDEVMAIGFPIEAVTRYKDEKELPDSFALLASPMLSKPMVSNGTVFDTKKGANSFEINIFTYHGFSGGPVINKKGKLIGITHGASWPQTVDSITNYFEFHSDFKKSTLLMPLLHEVLIQVQSQEMQDWHPGGALIY